MIRDPSDGSVDDFWEGNRDERIDPDEPVEEEVAFLDFAAARALINRKPDGPEAA